MKQHIEVEQLIEIGAERVLTLANHKLIETIWADFDNLEKVDYAIKVFKEKGWKHSTLLSTAKKCSVATLIAMLDQNGKVNFENYHQVYNEQTLSSLWSVCVSSGSDKSKFQSDCEELCDALWEAVKQIVIK